MLSRLRVADKDGRLSAPPASDVNKDPRRPADVAVPPLEGWLGVMATTVPHGVQLSGISTVSTEPQETAHMAHRLVRMTGAPARNPGGFTSDINRSHFVARPPSDSELAALWLRCISA